MDSLRSILLEVAPRGVVERLTSELGFEVWAEDRPVRWEFKSPPKRRGATSSGSWRERGP